MEIRSRPETVLFYLRKIGALHRKEKYVTGNLRLYIPKLGGVDGPCYIRSGRTGI